MVKQRLSVRARAQLVSDVFSMAQAGCIGPQVPLDFIKYMSKENDYLPWNTLLNNRIAFYMDMLESTEYYGDFVKFLSGLVKAYYERLGWIEDREKEDPVDGYVYSFLHTN